VIAETPDFEESVMYWTDKMDSIRAALKKMVDDGLAEIETVNIVLDEMDRIMTSDITEISNQMETELTRRGYPPETHETVIKVISIETLPSLDLFGDEKSQMVRSLLLVLNKMGVESAKIKAAIQQLRGEE